MRDGREIIMSPVSHVPDKFIGSGDRDGGGGKKRERKVWYGTIKIIPIPSRVNFRKTTANPFSQTNKHLHSLSPCSECFRPSFPTANQ